MKNIYEHNNNTRNENKQNILDSGLHKNINLFKGKCICISHMLILKVCYLRGIKHVAILRTWMTKSMTVLRLSISGCDILK